MIVFVLDNVIELSRFMSKNHKLHDAISISTDHKFHFVESPLAHQNFYVLDLDCEGADALLIQVLKWMIMKYETVGNHLFIMSSTSIRGR